MGIVQKNSLKITIISYIGAAVGYINKILLFPNFLDADQVGLANIIVNIAVIFTQLSALGTLNIVLRFFPFFKNDSKQHHGFLFWQLFILFAGFLLISLLFIITKPSIIPYYINSSPLLVEYYYYIIPLSLAVLLSTFFDNYLRSLMKTVLPSFVSEILLRILITLSISLYALKVIDFHQFVIVYISVYCLISLALIIYTAYLKQLHLKPQINSTVKRFSKIIIVFGLFSILSNISGIIVTSIDSLMVAGMINLKATGIYTTVVFITSLLLIPYRAIIKVTAPIVAELWRKKDIHGLGNLYQKVTLNNLVVGLFLFMGLWINLENIFSFIPKEYSSGVFVFLFVGIGRLFDMTTGINGVILMTSKKYKYDIAFGFFLLILTVSTNYFLIPRYGINGAAIATMATLVIYNSFRVIFVYWTFNIQPFSRNCLWIILISVIPIFVSYQIHYLGNVYLDILVRSSICSIIFIIPLYLFKLSPEINSSADDVLRWLHLKK